MSSISSAGGTSLYQWLQAQDVNTQNSTSSPPVPGQTDDSTDAAGTAVQGSGHKHHGHHHGGSNGVSTQLQSAITSALSSANGSSDPNQIIESTIKQFLQGQSDQSSAQAAGSTSTSSASGTPQSATDPASQQSAFAQLLTSNGVDPQQFQQDLQAALQDASSNGGSVDFSKVFQNFPPGSAVNVLA